MSDETPAGCGSTPAAILSEMLQQAGTLMNQASGGASACSLTKAGISVPSLKYAEGRWAALKELKSQGADRKAAEHLGAQWHEHLAALEAREASRDWLAYRSGGVDALTEFAERARPRA
ncbi:hypothetical protein [Leucobacter sp. W1478]|uniref:hypothetical protein n=1 Tax=Leucobacter sp. W1478 TaxID=3439065 RepID=UPI003F390222